MSRVRAGLAVVATVVLLAGCASEADQLAADACNLLEEAFGGDADVEAMRGVQEDMQKLAQRTEEADVSDEEMQAAMQDECPDVMETMRGFAPGQ